MIPRYSRKEMQAIWDPINRFNLFLEIELHACDKMADLGIIPKESAINIRKKAKFKLSRIEEIEKETRHDFLAFLTNISENVGDDSRFIHQGMTSSDVLDTALSIQLSQASDIIIQDIKKILLALKEKSIEHKYTPTMGRSHGVHAEKTTFGLKLASFYSEFKRNLFRMQIAKNEISICALSGPVGTFASIDPRIEQYVAEKFNLMVEPVSSQVIPRDRHASFFSTLAVVASSIERLATELRNLQRTEILEVEEFFHKGQKGSSAMPHKRNPILSENITGISRYIRGMVIPALENVILWHERDISHSSVERIIGPDATTALDFALNRVEYIIKNLVVHKENMKINIEKLKGLNNSQDVLLALTQKGLSREKAYNIVQKAAEEVWDKGTNFQNSLLNITECKKVLNKEEISKIINNEKYKLHINTIYNRIFTD
ncbi:MAG: Adenylosuccinate lyase [Alphaproteobacteria bacterium MarineAlpha5_Bin11]|nr:adenylosuccinate lyase [Pelagibacteraceae bacterium]PPR43695.1 MAG: Adenylosuccinate lyase [Alphaproteobacteria bacterium MarineAlpha5_Bin11]PPR51347.1 MAG: Adenylosuccinate lyase [Alphaproteobacteria bacterium MarineAlpha5_Bin10]|tara:strand:- start:27593 stop:28888 length:1296 start_codon:yes stop_codon:yes gene_type:complete